MAITEESQLINAAKNGNLDALKILHAQHTNLDYQDADGWTALMTACATHHADCALFLISCGVNLELTADDGWTALMIALDHNQTEIVIALLDAGAKTGRFNWSGMCELCITAKKPHLTDLLLQHGADPNQPHPILPLCRPLFLTLSHCKDANPEFVRTLVKYGADVNAQTKEGQTPLMVSVVNANITKVLLECGADLSIRDQDGESAFDYAQKPEADPKALGVLKTAQNRCSAAPCSEMSMIAKRIGARYDEMLNYFKACPFGSMPSDLTVLSLLPPVDRCLIIERILQVGNGDRLTCIDKLSMAYLKAGWRDLADKFIQCCDACGWLPEQCDYGFFQDKLNNIVVSNVSKRYVDTLRKFPQYDTQSQFCKIVKALCVRYNGKEILLGNEIKPELDAFRKERLEFIKNLGNDTGSKNVIPQAAEPGDIRERNMFAAETNCYFDVADIKGLTIFCDRYGATLSIGNSQLFAWYKVDLKPGSMAKGDYVFNGYLYISGKDFVKLKPILVKRGWVFHVAKSGPPFFAEGEMGAEPAKPPSHPAKNEDNKTFSDVNEKASSTAKNSSPKEKLPNDVPLDKKPLDTSGSDERISDSGGQHQQRGCLTKLMLFFGCAVVLCAIIYGVLKAGVEVFRYYSNESQQTGKGENELKRKEAEGVELKQREAYVARIKELEKAREEARRKEDEAHRREKAEESARKQREAEERRRRAQEEERMAKVSAGSAKHGMWLQCNKAKSAGAKEHAISEWNDAVGKWKAGDDRFKNGDYGEASALYNQAGSLFVKAERIPKSCKTAKLTAELSDLQGKAAALVEESDKWWKWSVDDSALLEMGNAINKSLYEGENIPSFSIANRNELEMLLVRCYELASKGGSGEASFRLALLYGAAENLVNPYSGVVIRRDNKLAEQYLKRAIAQKHALAKSLYDVMH